MRKYKNIRYISDQTSCIETILCEKSTISYPLHNHIFNFTAVIVIDGIIKTDIARKSSFYKQNDIFIIPPYTPHSITSVSPYTIISLCIDKNSVKKFSAEEIKYKIEKLFKEIETNFFTDFKDYRFADFISCKLKNSEYKEDLGISENLKKQLELFPENKINICDMATTEYINKYQFIRNFKKKIGLTPHRFLIQNRIRKSQKLIEKGAALSETAVTMGFYDQSHFIKYFKDIVGLTPTDYKMACKNNFLNLHKPL